MLYADFTQTNTSTRPSTNRTVSVSISNPIQPFIWTRSRSLNTWGQANNRASHVNSIFTLNLKPWFYYGEKQPFNKALLGTENCPDLHHTAAPKVQRSLKGRLFKTFPLNEKELQVALAIRKYYTAFVCYTAVNE